MLFLVVDRIIFILIINFRNGGLCFYECKFCSIFIDILEGFILIEMGRGVQNKKKVSCLWLIFLLSNSSYNVVYGLFFLFVEKRGYIIFIFRDFCINCFIDYVEVYDGFFFFVLDNLLFVQLFYKLGLFCDWSGNKLRFVMVKLGNMVVFVKVDLSFGVFLKGFSVKFKVRKCLDFCDGNMKCVMILYGE